MSEMPLQNLRVHLYGTQGSGSVFPSRAERQAIQRRGDHELLALVFADIARHATSSGRLDCSVEDLIGGPLTTRAITGYAARFEAPEPRVYGGWTTCVRIETGDGDDIVLDCGSRFRNCARDLQAKWAARPEWHLHIFGSHSHLDHTEGFDQAAVCFDPRNHLHIYGNHQFCGRWTTTWAFFPGKWRARPKACRRRSSSALCPQSSRPARSDRVWRFLSFRLQGRLASNSAAVLMGRATASNPKKRPRRRPGACHDKGCKATSFGHPVNLTQTEFPNTSIQ